MPTSAALGWTVQPTPVFQVYGTKRKNDFTDEYQVTESQDTGTKRHCTEERHHHDNNIHHGNNITSPLHIHPSIHPIIQSHHNDHEMDTQTDSSQEHTTFSHHQQHFHQPSSMDLIHHQTPVMDVSHQQMPVVADEVVEEACHTMDDDFVPNTQQYNNTQAHNTSYSFDGEYSPRSARVRCYCKPTWEGINDMRPYVSDIY